MEKLMDRPKIIIKEKSLSLLLIKEEDGFCVYCPELDLVTESSTSQSAIEDMIEEIVEYCDEYMREIEIYTRSPNRFHHLPYVKTVASCKQAFAGNLMYKSTNKHK
ncbi:MAG: hypothetical protein AB1414_08505 [bacterium]